MHPAGQTLTADKRPETDTPPEFRRALVRRRTELEAKLLAHRCDWRVLDEIRLRRLRRSLSAVLEALGEPDPAEALTQTP
jgi:hypothetical protein